MNPREEIKDIAPKLSLWKYGEGYKIPDGYFEGLSDRICERVEEDEKLDKYFSALPDEVMQKIKQEQKGKVMSIRPFLKYAVAAAFFMIMGTLVWNNVDSEFASDQTVSLEDSEELNYIIEAISLEDIFDTEFIDDETFEEILVNEDDEFIFNNSTEELLYEVDDELLEEFL